MGHDGDPLTAKLAFDPGTHCGYSSFALYHASLVCEDVTGKPYDQFAIEMLFRPIGVEHWTFEYFDGGGPDGDQRYGRHPSHSLGMPARDLARIAYCMLHGGRWQDRQIVPKWFVDETAAPTHDVKEPEMRFKRTAESFSHGWELPARLTDGRGDGIPTDARFKPGSGGQLIAFVPSLDLVITRQTGSAGNWDYEQVPAAGMCCSCARRITRTVIRGTSGDGPRTPAFVPHASLRVIGIHIELLARMGLKRRGRRDRREFTLRALRVLCVSQSSSVRIPNPSPDILLPRRQGFALVSPNSRNAFWTGGKVVLSGRLSRQ